MKIKNIIKKINTPVFIIDNKHFYASGRIVKITPTHYLIESKEPFGKKSKTNINPYIKLFPHNLVVENTRLKEYLKIEYRDQKINQLLESY